MKALRYLLIVMSLVSVLSVRAQSTAQLPEAEMKSTSAMVGSGSTLPQAAATGIYVTGNSVGAYSPARLPNRPVRRDPGDDWEDDEYTEPENPWKNPLGDVLWPMMLMALAYVVYLKTRKKKENI